MQLFLGSFITLVAFLLISKIFYRDLSVKRKTSIYIYKQSNIHHLISPFIQSHMLLQQRKETQSKKHFDKTNIKVIIVDNDAFWIKDNVFYTAKMDEQGVDKETTSVVDTMNMDKVQLDKMLFIIDQLRDGNRNDSGNSRD